MKQCQAFMKYSSILIVIAVGFYFVCIWNNIPERIGTHFRFDGVIDRRGNKMSILSYPFLVALVSMICYHGVNVFVEKVRSYHLTLGERLEPFLLCLMQTLVFFLVMMLSYMMITSAHNRNLGAWFGMVMVIGVIGITMLGCVGSFITWRKFK